MNFHREHPAAAEPDKAAEAQDEELEQMARDFARTRDEDIREALMLRYQETVNRSIGFFSPLNSDVDKDVLTMVGNNAVAFALEYFDPDEGTPFSLVAKHAIRSEVGSTIARYAAKRPSLSGSVPMASRSMVLSIPASISPMHIRFQTRRRRARRNRGTFWQRIVAWAGRLVLRGHILTQAQRSQSGEGAVAATSALDAQIDELLPAIERTNQRLDRLHFLVRDMVDDLREARSSGNAPAARAGEEATA